MIGDWAYRTNHLHSFVLTQVYSGNLTDKYRVMLDTYLIRTTSYLFASNDGTDFLRGEKHM